VYWNEAPKYDNYEYFAPPKMIKTVFSNLSGVSFFRASGIYAMLCVVLCAACTKKDGLPAGVLSKQEMVRVLSDFYIAEEKLNRLNLTPDTTAVLARIIEDNIYEKTGIPDSIFAVSFDYYMKNPKELELIYTALVDSMQLKEQRMPSSNSK
jgi:hypothetical protein